MTNKVDPTQDLPEARLIQDIERWVLRARINQDEYSAHDTTLAIYALFTKHSEQVEREARIDTAEHLHRQRGRDLAKRDFDTDTDEYICNDYIPSLKANLTQPKE